MRGNTHNYILAIAHHNGHSEALIIDPVKKINWMGMAFHGVDPATPDGFVGEGALLIPITKQSAETLRDVMDQLKLTYPQNAPVEGGISHSDRAAHKVIDRLEDLAIRYPQHKELLEHGRAQIDTMIDESDMLDTTMFDDLPRIADLLRDMAGQVEDSTPTLRDALIHDENPDAAIHLLQVPFTPYYDANRSKSIAKYERRGVPAMDFTGEAIIANNVSPDLHKRPADSMPMVGTNCLNFTLRAAQDIAGIPLTDIDPSLRDSFSVHRFADLISYKLNSPDVTMQGGVFCGLLKTDKHQPYGIVTTVAQNIHFPEDLFAYEATENMMKKLATCPPLSETSISHAVMR